MREITDAQFSASIKAGAPPHRVIVDFYTDHCAPCKVMEDVIKQVEPKIDATFLKINVGKELQNASQLMVTQVPTLILFVDGDEVKRHQGVMGGNDLKEWVGV